MTPRTTGGIIDECAPAMTVLTAGSCLAARAPMQMTAETHPVWATTHVSGTPVEVCSPVSVFSDGSVVVTAMSASASAYSAKSSLPSGSLNAD